MAVSLLTSAVAPTNVLAGNPAALKRTFETGGLSLLRGTRNLVGDLRHNGGMPAQVDRRPFRVGENLAALEMFRDHPVAGVGPDNFELRYPVYAQRVALDPRPEVRGAHSLYLESLAETGIIGTVAFVALPFAAPAFAGRAADFASCSWVPAFTGGATAAAAST
jgi:hypothetical protein